MIGCTRAARRFVRDPDLYGVGPIECREKIGERKAESGQRGVLERGITVEEAIALGIDYSQRSTPWIHDDDGADVAREIDADLFSDVFGIVADRADLERDVGRKLRCLERLVGNAAHARIRDEGDVGNERTPHFARRRESKPPFRHDLAATDSPRAEPFHEPTLDSTVVARGTHLTDGTAAKPLRFRFGFR